MTRNEQLQQARMDEQDKLKGMGASFSAKPIKAKRPKYSLEGHSRNGEPLECVYGKY